MAALDGALASEGARDILHDMQNEALRLMISRGQGLRAMEEPVRCALAEGRKA